MNTLVRRGLGAASRVSVPLAARLAEVAYFRIPRRRYAASEARALNAATRSEMRVGRRRVPIYRWGRGPTILFVHGWGGHGAQVSSLVGPLVEQGFEVVSFDGPAHGRASGRTTDIPELARVAAGVARELGAIHGVVTHSVGGLVLALAASEHGLVTPRVVALSPLFSYRTLLRGFQHQMGLTSEVIDRMVVNVERRVGYPFMSTSGEVSVPRQSARAVVIHDRDDALVPVTEGRRFARVWPGARLVETQGYGHYSILHRTRVLRATVEHLMSGS